MHLETLDLHGYTIPAAMTRFVQAYNRLLTAPTSRDGQSRALEVIHGRSLNREGDTIRETLRHYLNTQGKRIKGYDAQLALRGADYLLDNSGKLAYMHGEDAKRNPGCTIVVPLQRLTPSRHWLLY